MGSLSYQTLKNSSYNLVNYILPMFFSLAITPVMVNKLGIADFGIYALVNAILAFLSLLDLGFSSALMKKISEYDSNRDKEKLQKIFNSANTVYLTMGLVGVLIFYILGKYFLQIFGVSDEWAVHVRIIFFFASLTFFVSAVNSVYTVVPAGLQRYDITSKINAIYLFVFNISVLIALLLGFKLKAVFIINFLSLLLLTVLYRNQFNKILPGFKNSFSLGYWQMKEVFIYGFFSALIQLAATALSVLDRLLLPTMLGPAQLAFYVLPGNITQKNMGITGAVSAHFFPLASKLSEDGDSEGIKKIYIKIIKNIPVLAAAITFAQAVFAYPLLKFWVGQDIAEKGAKILVILSVTYFILAVYQPFVNFLYGLGRLKFLFVTSLCSVVINILTLFWLVPIYGIQGAAWAFLISVLPIPLFIIYIQIKYIKTGLLLGMHVLNSLKILFVGTIFWFFSKTILVPIVNDIFSLVVIGGLSVFLYLLVYYILGFFPKEDVALVKDFVAQVKIKFFNHVKKS